MIFQITYIFQLYPPILISSVKKIIDNFNNTLSTQWKAFKLKYIYIDILLYTYTLKNLSSITILR